MGFLKSIFGGAGEAKEEKVLPWVALNDISQLEEVVKKSKSKTQVIFKHSTRCGISRMVLSQFVGSYAYNDQDVDLYYLDLLNYRTISDEVGYKFQVLHQSPQLLVIRNGVVVAHASHGAVNEINLASFI